MRRNQYSDSEHTASKTQLPIDGPPANSGLPTSASDSSHRPIAAAPRMSACSPLNDFFAGPRWRAWVRRASVPNRSHERVVAVDAARVALGRLGRSPIGCDPYQPLRRLRVLPAVARGANNLKQLHVLGKRREGVAIDRHGRDRSTLREFSAACQSVPKIVSRLVRNVPVLNSLEMSPC
jgi:hypothetical protein